MKPYASYKPSGVAWLNADIPSQWISKRIKHVAAMQSGEGITAETIDQSGTYPVYGGNGIRGFTAEKTHSGEFVLVGRQGALCGNVHHVVGDFWASEHAVVSALYAGDNPRWAAYILEFMNLGQYSMAAAQPGLAVDKIQQLQLPVPPPDEQQAIADYLDTETARIDTLVQEKEELVGLLREAKLSTVSSILLGGLVGEIKKPSNTKWLGDVPASWVVCRVKHAVMRIEQGWSPECENRLCAPGEWGVLKAGACNHGRFNQAEHKFLPATLNPIPEYEVFAGDVLMSRASGSADLVGSVAFVDEVQPHLMLSDKLFRLVPEEHVDGRYLAWALNTDAQRRQILNCVRGAEGLARNITTTDIKQLWIALPTLDEQKQLAVEANKVASGFDALITHTQEEIALLKELRAATIADAVLGRVDVRSLNRKQ